VRFTGLGADYLLDVLGKDGEATDPELQFKVKLREDGKAQASNQLKGI